MSYVRQIKCSAQSRGQWRVLVNSVINLWVPQNVGNFLTNSAIVSFSRTIIIYGVSYLVN
jgi:hypothetical protein